jgi:putative serine/threonine protein kinase
MNRNVTISLQTILGTRYADVLSYPRNDLQTQEERVEELEKLKVSDLVFYEGPRHFDLGILGKGCVGVVVVGHVGSKRVAVKIRRMDADRTAMRFEAKLLDLANSVDVGPKLYAASNNFLLMQLIVGNPLSDWLAKKADVVLLKMVLRDILEQCFRLDQVGLDHGELSCARRHIVICRSGRPFMLDFETASVERRTANVTSVCQFMFFSSLVERSMPEKEFRIDYEKLIEVLRRYKQAKSRENFEEILSVCNLQTM